jgi:hypothetical protein
MRISVGLIFGLTLLWSAIFTSLYIVFRMVLLKESPGRNVVDLVDIDTPQNETSIRNQEVNVQRSVQPSADSINSTSKYAYVTLLHGIDSTFTYRGFLYNCLIVKRALDQQHSMADFIVLIGFTYGEMVEDPKIASDLNLLRKFGIKLYFLPRLTAAAGITPVLRGSTDTSAAAKASSNKHSHKKVPFLEMALLKITPFSFTQYEKIQFFDGDVIPHTKMDCFFELSVNTFNTGNASPLNSGWFVAIPNITDYEAMKSKALKRMHGKHWDEKQGWGTPIPPSGLYFRGGGRAVPKWSFNGASLDQGLMTDHFILHEGRAQLIDTDGSPAPVRVYDAHFQQRSQPLPVALQSCTRGQAGRDASASGKTPNTLLPTDYFYHYTGKNKPWLQDLRKPKDKAQRLWAQHLDALHLSVNSSNINAQGLNSPLGYFYPNK